MGWLSIIVFGLCSLCLPFQAIWSAGANHDACRYQIRHLGSRISPPKDTSVSVELELPASPEVFALMSPNSVGGSLRALKLKTFPESLHKWREASPEPFQSFRSILWKDLPFQVQHDLLRWRYRSITEDDFVENRKIEHFVFNPWAEARASRNLLFLGKRISQNETFPPLHRYFATDIEFGSPIETSKMNGLNFIFGRQGLRVQWLVQPGRCWMN